MADFFIGDMNERGSFWRSDRLTQTEVERLLQGWLQTPNLMPGVAFRQSPDLTFRTPIDPMIKKPVATFEEAAKAPDTATTVSPVRIFRQAGRVFKAIDANFFFSSAVEEERRRRRSSR